MPRQSPSVTILSGGVGGARLARGIQAITEALTVIVNVGDDERIYGLDVSPDLDTVLYTMAGLEGPQGWGVAGDSHVVMGHLEPLGVDTTFRVGDRDLATHLYRTDLLRRGTPLSTVTARLAELLGVEATVLPATDDPLRTRVRVSEGGWLSFQDYFVHRGHRDEVLDIHFEGADAAKPARGVTDAITHADLVVIGPSNPPLSIWPILAVPGIADALESADRVVGVSPLFGGRALKGPADRVMRSLGLPESNAGVVAAYQGLLDELIIDIGDAAEAAELARMGMEVRVTDTRIREPDQAGRFAAWLLR